MSRARAWDAAAYDRVSDPQVEMARGVLARLELRGHETVLDAGCGSGRVTRMLLDRLPHGRVIGVDSSPEMVEHARAALGDRATIILADLTELEIEAEADVVFSNAVFHWVLDHDRLFRRLHAALKPGGRLVAQCGGEGNVEAFLGLVGEVAATPRFASHMAGFTRPVRFASAEETVELLRSAGFDPVRTWLEPRDVTPDDPAGFLRAVVLGVHLDWLPDELRDEFVETVIHRSGGTPVLDFVRLNIDAVRPG